MRRVTRRREDELVSIVVSNYNNEEYIIDCLDSLINQTYQNVELIIIDDCSTDKSSEVIERWVNTKGKKVFDKGKLVFLKLPKNIGFSGAVTTGLFLARGEYLAMQDGDDISAKERLTKQVKYLKENQGIKAIGTNYYTFQNNIESAKLSDYIVYGKENINKSFYEGKSPVSYGTLMIKGEMFDKVGGLTRKIDGAEDYEFLAKLIGYGIDNIKEGLYYYREHDKQRSREFYSEKINKSKITKDKLSVLLVLDQLNIGGTETHVLCLAKELIKQGVKVSILAENGELECEFRNLNCKIYNMKMPTTIVRDTATINSYKQSIKKILEIEQTNIVHLHQSPSGSLVMEAAKDKNIPMIFTIHGMYYHDIVSTMLKTCNKVISVSIPVFKWLSTFGVQSSIIPNGISYSDFSYDEKGIEIRKNNGLKESDYVAMYCSRMAWGKIKTCENLIRVCRDLTRKENKEIHGLIVGDGPGFEELKKVGDRANNTIGKEIIHFTGGQTDIPKYYSASDIVIGTGRVAIEAMAAKKPVIATGNNGYFGIVNEKNFDEAWNMYFGDHNSIKPNNAMYLYEDMKKISEKGSSCCCPENIFNKSIDIFEIKNITKKLIDLYLEALE
ncbi:glycosyltransferase [uncultured Clostridium sp.]|uniref:glycosyltransferase n=1 Tax=uncultured Clostridium sp. TaxID=59620 RepID=UPI00262BA3FA|nr:glycosyltransferase [uncultured Clostridium sp.]